MVYSKFEEIPFQNRARERLRQTYAVLFYLKSGSTRRQAISKASDYFPQINDPSQTIESKISTQIRVSLDTFFEWYKRGTILSELIPRLHLNEHDRNIFDELLNSEITPAPHVSQDSLELPTLPEEIDTSHERLIEGAATTIAINAYERNPKARKRCVEHYGAICRACDFTFQGKYGSIGQGYIHVHHLLPMSAVKEDYTVDPIRDLVPICPNCHAVIHSRKPPYSIEELRELIKNNI